jgi:hypothetical protein
MCGQPSLDTTSVSEAATRVFEATAERPAAQTQAWQSQPTGPAYMSPAGASPLKDAATRSLEPTGQSQKKSWLVLSFALIFLAVVFTFAVGMMLRGRMATTTPTQTPPVVTVPDTGLPPPPPPPAAPPAPGTSTPTSDLVYPGAQTIMDMKTGSGNFLQLSTTDPVDKVVDWYVTKVKGAEIFRTPEAGAVLRAGETQIVISPGSKGSSIIIKQGSEK